MSSRPRRPRSSEIEQLVTELHRREAAMRDWARSLDGSSHRDERWLQLAAQTRITEDQIRTWVQAVADALARNESPGIDRGLSYLEADPFYFRSGYTRARMAGLLAHANLDPEQLERARTVVLAAVDGELHVGHPAISRLAGAVADNELRRALRTRLHVDSTAIALRSLRALAHIAHPGYAPRDIEAARNLVLRSRTFDYALAMRLWDPQWERDLTELVKHHGPDRARAKRLLEQVERRRRRKEEKRSGP